MHEEIGEIKKQGIMQMPIIPIDHNASGDNAQSNAMNAYLQGKMIQIEGKVDTIDKKNNEFQTKILVSMSTLI